MPICARNITTLRFFNHAFIVCIIIFFVAKVVSNHYKGNLILQYLQIIFDEPPLFFDEFAPVIIFETHTMEV